MEKRHHATLLIGHLRLALAAAALAGLAAPVGAHATASTQPGCVDADLVPTQANVERVRQATLCLVNQERVVHHRPRLAFNRDLAQAASDYVTSMTARGFFGHVSPDGSTPTSRIKVTLYLEDARSWSLGENLAWGDGPLATARQMVAAWMHSPPHRRNMLSSRFRHLGVGIAIGTPDGGQPGATYATEFGVRVTAR